MRHRQTPRLLAIFLAVTAMVPLLVAPAGAAVPNSKVTVFDRASDASAVGGAPTPVPAAAEIVEATLTHDVDNIKLSVRFKGPSDPLNDPNVDAGKSFLTWYLDTDDGSYSEARLSVVNGTHVAKLTRGNSTCEAKVSYDVAKYLRDVTFPRSCIGQPTRIRFHIYSEYTPSLSDPANPNAHYVEEAGGEYSATSWSPWAERARTRTQLSSAVSAGTIVYSQGVTVSGTLARTSDGKAVSGQKVDLYRKYPGGSYSRIATLKTDSSGKVSFQLTPSKRATYQLRHAYAGEKGPGFDAVQSVARTINVRPKASLSASATTVKSGASVKLTAKVAPKLAGKEVWLQQRRSDGSWKTVQKGKLNSSSARTFSVKASTSTKGSYRVFVPKSDIHADGASPVVTIKLG